jgi:hypothetical protein
MDTKEPASSRRSFLLLTSGLCVAAVSARGWLAARRLPPSTKPGDQPASPAPQTFEEFMSLSARLTGVPLEGLDEEAGRVYFASLRGAFDEESILLCWYTGRYGTAQDRRVHTWEGALAWSTLGFTTAQMQCHPQWWVKRAELAL